VAQDDPTEAVDTRIGYATTGLPGYGQVILPRPTPWLIGVAASAGYGLTTDALQMEDSHHRLMGRLGISIAPIDWLQVALQIDGRYDTHSLAGGMSDDGFVGDPRLILRAGGDLGGLILGGEVVVWVPGVDAPSMEFGATTLDLKAAGGYMISPDFSFALNAGFRIDNSASAVANQGVDLSPSDRMSLGLSQWSAVLLGFGGAYRFGPGEIWAEWSWDVLVGDGAPDVGVSPMRVDLGARFWVDDPGMIQLHAGIGFLVSSYPTPDATSGQLPLMPIEPRFDVNIGATFRFPTPAQAAIGTGDDGVDDTHDDDTDGELVRVEGRVLDPSGQPVGGATVTVTTAEGEALSPATTDDQGAFAIADVPAGPGATLTVAAEGYRPSTESLDATAGGRVTPEVRLERDLPRGQLRGAIQSFRGEPVPATIRVTPGDHQATAGDDGAFEIDLDPGDYEVIISAPGYAEQTRPVHIEVQGVTILNVDLRRN
jgi:hypothetical protein